MSALLSHWRRSLHLLVLAACCVGGCTKAAAPSKRSAETQSSSTKEQLAPTLEADESPRRTLVARVLGKEIFEDELAPPADTYHKPLTDAKLREYREAALHSRIWEPLMDKYCLDHHIQPTKEEIEQYEASMGTREPETSLDDAIRRIQKSLESDALSDSDKRDASELLKLLQADGTETYDERMIRFFRSKLKEKDLGEEKRRVMEETLTLMEGLSKQPENMVRWWKFNRALYAEFGGVVIFQQSNPREPVGAYRKWLEAHEQAGDFAILNDEARAAFWEYFKQDWQGTNVVVHDPDPLGQPWWLKKPTGEDEKTQSVPRPAEP